MTHCRACGVSLASDPSRHVCPPNDTGFLPGETVRAGDATGQVLQVSRAAVEVYFPAAFRSQWYPAADLKRVA